MTWNNNLIENENNSFRSEEDFLKSEEEHISKKVKSIDDNFDLFLKENDSNYANQIFFLVSYNQFEDFYKINISPAKKGLDSQKYFKDNFGTESGKEKLDKFKKENDIKLITY